MFSKRLARVRCALADEGADVGVDAGTPVTEDYSGPENRFGGTIKKVTVQVD